MTRITKAVLPAAGLGTRFLPATKAIPKEMLPIVDKPTIQYIVEEAVASGITDILVVVGRNKQCIEDHFDRAPELEQLLDKKHDEKRLAEVLGLANMAELHFVRQKQALGLGHAVHCARSFVGNEPFAVLLGDNIVHSQTPALRQLMDVYDQTGCSVLAVQDVPEEQVSRFGIVGCGPSLNQNTFRVTGLVEKPPLAEAPSRTAIYGRYVITPEIFEILQSQSAGAGGEIQLTDALRTLLSFQTIYATRICGQLYDVGDKLGFLQATVEYALRDPSLSQGLRAYLQALQHAGTLE